MKVVFDTNIYVSALAIPGGAAERAMRMAMEGAFDLAISRPILGELLMVLSRKFAREPEGLARTAIFISSLAEVVAPSVRIQALRQDADNRILERASAAGADFIVTGDQEILALRAWQGIEIVSLRELLERFGRDAMQSRAVYRASARMGGHEVAAELGSHDLAFLAKLLRKRRGDRRGLRPL
jgi:uncharacterized protein